MSAPPPAPLPPPRHLLVRLPNPLGDAVLATSALRALREALPTTRITWVGRRAPLEALAGLEARDGVLPERGPLASGVRAPWEIGRFWRRTGCDAVLLLVHAFSAAVAARVSGAKVRVGSGREGGFLLTRRVALPAEGGRLEARPMERMYADLVRPFGAEVAEGARPKVVAAPFDLRRAARRLGPAVSPGTWFVVNPGAGFGPTKIYPAERMGRAAKLVGEATGLVPLIACGKGEEALARKVAEAAGPSAIPTHEDPPDVGELKALLRGAALCLSTDAGPRHLAEALGVPTVVVMGPTDARWTGESTATLVRNEALDCLGCHRKTCPIVGHPCMEDLAPEKVADACLHF